VRDGRRLIAVVMGGRSSKWRDSRTASLLNMGFQRLRAIRIAEAMKEFRPRPKPGTEAAVAFAEYLATRRAAAVQQASLQQAAATPSVEAKLQPSAGLLRRAATATNGIPIPRPKPRVQSADLAIPVPLPKPTVQTAGMIVPVPLPKPMAQSVALVVPVPLPKPTVQSAGLMVPVPSPKPERAVPPHKQAKAGVWGIQVGAFSRRAPAYLAIERAQRYAPTLLLSSLIRIEEFASSQRKLFRARMLGLEEAEARTACRVLQKQSMACLLVPPHERITVAANN
jgi:D-alanyl-D-alanine carboxypeptidase